MLGIKATIHITSKLFISFLQLIGIITVVRFMGPEPIGIIGYFAGIIGMFAVLSNLGFSTTHRKKISEGKNLGRCVGTYLTIRLFLMFIWVFSLFVWIIFFGNRDGALFENESEKYTFYVILLYIILEGHSGVLRHTLWAKLEATKVMISRIIARVFTVSLKIIVAISGFGIVYLASAQLVGYIILIIVLIYMYKGYSISKPSRAYISEYVRFTLPIMLTVPLPLLAANLDYAMIGYYSGPKDVAFYSVPLQISQSLGIMTGTIGLILLPLISSSFADKKIRRIQATINLSEKYLLLYLIPMVSFFLVASEEIVVTLFGNSFLPASDLLRMHVVIITLIILVRPYSTLLIATGNLSCSFTVGLVTFLVHVILNFILIPDNFLGYEAFNMGNFGAAVATLVSFVFANILARYYSYKMVGIKQTPSNLLYLFSGVLMFCFMFVSNELLVSINPYWTLLWIILIGISGLIVNFIFLYVFELINNEDIKYIFLIFNPRKVKEQMIAELNRKP